MKKKKRLHGHSRQLRCYGDQKNKVVGKAGHHPKAMPNLKGSQETAHTQCAPRHTPSDMAAKVRKRYGTSVLPRVQYANASQEMLMTT